MKKQVIGGLAVITLAVGSTAQAQETTSQKALDNNESKLQNNTSSEIKQKTELELEKEHVQKDIASTEQAIEQTQENLTTAQTTLTEAEKKVSEQDKVVSALNNSLEVSTKEVVEAENEVQDIQSVMDGTREKTLRDAVANQNSTLIQADETVKSAQEALEQAEKAENTQTAEVQKITDELQKSQNDVDKTASLVSQAEQELEEARVVEEALKVDVANIKQTITTLKETYQTTETTAIQGLTMALNDLEKAQEVVRQTQLALDRAKSDDEKRQLLIKQLEAQLKNNKASLSQAYQNLDSYTRSYAQAKTNTDVTSMTYFNQADPRWSHRVYGLNTMGVSGCVPTSLAMIFSELTDRTVMPTEVADYLYNNTTEFNKRFFGTSAVGVLLASRHYGVTAQELDSVAEIEQALKDGHLVGVATQQNKFTPFGGSHYLVLKGFSNGNTYAYDPYTRSNIGWYPVSRLWYEQSTDKDDTAQIGAPFVKFMNARIAQLDGMIARAREAVNDAEATVNQTELKLSRARSASSNIMTLTNQLSNAKAKVREQDKAVQDARHNLNVVKATKANKSLELTKAEDQEQKLLVKLNDAVRSREDAESELATLKKQYANLTKQTDSIKSQLNNFKSSNVLLKAQEQLIRSKEKYTEAFNNHQRAKQTLEAFLQDKSVKVSSLVQAKERLEKAKAHYQEVKGRYSDAVNLLNELNQVAKKDREIVIGFNKTLLSYKEALNKLTEKLYELDKPKEVIINQTITEMKFDGFEEEIKSTDIKNHQTKQYHVPAFNTRGKVSEFVEEKMSKTPDARNEERVALSRASSRNAKLKVLPKTNEISSLWLSVLGGLLTLSNMLIFKSKKEN